ncbi:MAG: 4-(cytidine 5'-diphospho)-2-C-methyl-D-erythritol kinase [Rhizomicrobium sp.]
MPPRIEAFAPAKINLFLHVGDRRADGYHALESIAVFVDAGDRLVFEAADALSLRVEGPFREGLAAESDNLVLRAARALAQRTDTGKGAAIALTKNLPVASGIGGGSADAAAALRGLVQLWDLSEVGPHVARGVAEELGSDVPVCVESRPSWMEGRGEIVTRAKGIPPVKLVLVNPGVAVPTAAVFRALTDRSGVGAASRIPFEPDAWSLAEYLRSTRNDLEAPALAIAPAIGEALAALRAQPGIHLARMSGSGATCFGLFEDDGSAEMAAIALARSYPGWWVKAARVLA